MARSGGEPIRGDEVKKYQIVVNAQGYIILAYSARSAINKVLKSVIGTRTTDNMLPLTITVTKTRRNQTAPGVEDDIGIEL